MKDVQNFTSKQKKQQKLSNIICDGKNIKSNFLKNEFATK